MPSSGAVMRNRTSPQAQPPSRVTVLLITLPSPLQLDPVYPPAPLFRRRARHVVDPPQRRLAGLVDLGAGPEPAVNHHQHRDIERAGRALDRAWRADLGV